MKREKIKTCPLCGSLSIEHFLGDHVSKIRGTAHNVPLTICHDCREIFFGLDSLEVIRMYEQREKRVS